MMATPLDALAAGATMQGRSRTITDAEIAFLPALMGAISPLFHDEIRARESKMGGRILYGPALLGISIALTEHLLSDRVMGLVELHRVRFRRPVRVGDTITARLHVRTSTPRDGKPGLLLEIEDEVVDQHGETVLLFERLVLVKTPAPVATS
jgi:acyl dehydratase